MKVGAVLQIVEKFIAVFLAILVVGCKPARSVEIRDEGSVQSAASGFSDRQIASFCSDAKKSLRMSNLSCPSPIDFGLSGEVFQNIRRGRNLLLLMELGPKKYPKV